jgi:hypothetical protein
MMLSACLAYYLSAMYLSSLISQDSLVRYGFDIDGQLVVVLVVLLRVLVLVRVLVRVLVLVGVAGAGAGAGAGASLTSHWACGHNATSLPLCVLRFCVLLFFIRNADSLSVCV